MNESKSESDGTNSGGSSGPHGGTSSSGASRGTSFSESTNFSPVKVPQTLPHQLYGLKDGEMRVFLTGVKDGLTLTAPFYSEIKSRALRARPNPYFHKVPRRATLPKYEQESVDNGSWNTPGSGGGWDDDRAASSGNIFDGLFRGFQRNTNPDGGLPPDWREMLRAKGKMLPEWEEPQPWEPPAPGSGDGWDNDSGASSGNMFDQMFGKGRPSSLAPSYAEYEVTVKSYSHAKGYGVVALADGIAVLHANVVQTSGCAAFMRNGAKLRVHIQQGQDGRFVSKILNVVECPPF